jgi:inorganic phosphate transporter, PiT family
MSDLLGDLTVTNAALLMLALALALGFEFVNGFHDTANAVATVIYTHSLPPVAAVVWSGLWNLVGVLVSTGVVAFSVVELLPVELVLNVGSGAGFAMVFALLISAILWNLGTWYLGLPTSSSHTLIGSILGVGLANALLSDAGIGLAWAAPAWSRLGSGINWHKTQEVFVSLLTSPAIGFVGAGLLLLLAKWLTQPELFKAPDPDQPPPIWIRALLILTCTGVSFAHGSNDGQKGMGLIMLILVGLLPGVYALNLNLAAADIAQLVTLQPADWQTSLSQPLLTQIQSTDELSRFVETNQLAPATLPAMAVVQQAISDQLQQTSLAQLSKAAKTELRRDLYLVSETLMKLEASQQLPSSINPQTVARYRSSLHRATQFIPVWVKVAVAVALGLGTMVGWQRIVVTVGEKIGQEHLTYAQGAAAELVAMGTIIAADYAGLPVSTTHVLSSGVAGTMVANGSGVQGSTVRNILLAWVLTLPVCIGLGGLTFVIGITLIRALGVA